MNQKPKNRKQSQEVRILKKQDKLVGIRMESSLIQKLDQISKLEDLNRSSLLRRISRVYIREFEMKNEACLHSARSGL